jgi:photosystem II stability/assembly factor-like uncharacterized protein
MKRLSSLAFVAAFVFNLLSLPSASAQWIKQSPYPTNLALYTVAFTSPEHGFVGGQNSEWDTGGGLWETLDGGLTWTQRDIPNSTTDPINSLFFFDPARGWAMGNGSSPNCCHERTFDGGATWSPFSGPIGSTYDVRFLTPDFGHAVGNYGFAITRNGGVSWSYAPNSIHFVAFRNTSLGLGSSVNGLYRTTDGGLAFTRIRTESISNARFVNDTIALAVTTNGRILRSTDAGLTWTDRAASQGTTSLLVLSETQVISFRYDGRVLNSSDAGLTWTDRGIAVPDGVVNWAVVSDGVAVLVSGGGDVWRTADGGATWIETLPGLGDLPASWGVSFLDEQRGWVAGVHGIVFETTDSGITWHSLNSGNGAELNDIEMFDSQRGLAVGINGYVFRTEDGGARWNVDRLQVTGVVVFRNETLNAIDIVDDQFAVTAGDDGVAYKTADGGLTWTSIGYPTLPEDFTISDVHFRTREEGWVVGQDLDLGHFRTIYQTLDGGLTWTRPFDDTGSFSAVTFVGERGWMATLGNRFLRSTDGGATWTEGNLPNNSLGFSPTTLDMQFAADGLTGYAVGWYGYVAKTINGGVTWALQNTGTTERHLSDLAIVSANEVWASTYSGYAYHTTNGGTTWIAEPVNTRANDFASFEGIAVGSAGGVWTAGFSGFIYAKDVPAAAPVTVSAEPVNPPIVIPPGGGSFRATVTLTNTSATSQTVDLWTALSGAANREPLFGPRSITLTAGQTFTRTLTQRIPAGAPAGDYTYTANVGTFSTTVSDSDSFTFEKSATGSEKNSLPSEGASDWSASE